MHLGLTPWDMSAAAMATQARLAEQWGYDSIWLPESHFSGAATVPDPLLLLASMAGATNHIGLGTTSYLLPLRHPLQAAEQVAVLDQASNGRLILGLGRGYQAPTYAAFGIAMRQKRQIFAQTLQTMQRAWAGEELVMISGATPVRLAPLPMQQPHPPLWVAAFGPKALAQVGSLGLPYLASPVESCADLRVNYAVLRDACLAADQVVPDVVPIMRTIYVSDDATEIQQVRAELDGRIKAMGEDGPAHLKKAAQATLDDLVIVGNPAHVRTQLARYESELGVTHMIATRLRLAAMPIAQLRLSAQRLPEIL